MVFVPVDGEVYGWLFVIFSAVVEKYIDNSQLTM